MNPSGAELITGSCANLGFTNLETLNFQIDQTWPENHFLLNDYGLCLASSGLSTSTKRYYLSDARQFLEWAGNLPIVQSSMGGEIAMSYSEYLLQPAHYLRPNSIGRYSPSTIKRKLHSLRRFIDHLVDKGILPNNPFREFVAQIPQQGSSTREDTVLSIETIRQLISACDISKPVGIRDRALLLCMAGLGLRVGEIRMLDTGDVSLKDYSLTLAKRNIQVRTLPLSDEIAASLEMWLLVRTLHATDKCALFISLHHSKGRGEPGKRLSNRGIRSIINRKLEMVGAKQPGVSCEVIRRSVIIHSLVNGATLGDIRSMFGLNLRAMRVYEEYVSEIC